MEAYEVARRALNMCELLLARYEVDPFDEQRRMRTRFAVAEDIKCREQVVVDLWGELTPPDRGAQ